MKVSEVKAAFYRLAAEYFPDATVAWGETTMTKPRFPFMLLTAGSVHRPTRPEARVVGDMVQHVYPSTVDIVVNLYTAGKKCEEGYFENTAVNDLLEFVNFLNSEHATQKMERFDISLYQKSDVMDVSAITNEVQHEFRARTEFVVSFTQSAFGAASVIASPEGEWEKTPSGGSSEQLANEETGVFEKVEITNQEGTEVIGPVVITKPGNAAVKDGVLTFIDT